MSDISYNGNLPATGRSIYCQECHNGFVHRNGDMAVCEKCQGSGYLLVLGVATLNGVEKVLTVPCRTSYCREPEPQTTANGLSLEEYMEFCQWKKQQEAKGD